MTQQRPSGGRSGIRNQMGEIPGWRLIGVGVLSVGIVLSGFALFVLFARPLALLFLAVSIAAAFAPLVQRLSQRLPRTLVIIALYGLVFVVFIGLVLVLMPTLVPQIDTLRERLPDILEELRQLLNQYGISASQGDVLTWVGNELGARLVSLPLELMSGVLDAVLVLIVSLYVLIDTPKIRRFTLSLFGEAAQSQVLDLGLELAQTLGGYVRGIIIDVILVAVITTVGLLLIGLPFALVLGMISGLFEALPVVGSLIASVPILVIALLQSPSTALITLGFVVIVQQIEGNVIAPNVMKAQVDIPQFMVPLAILAGASAGGVLGALIAVPVVAALRVLFLRLVVPLIRQQTGAQPTTATPESGAITRAGVRTAPVSSALISSVPSNPIVPALPGSTPDSPMPTDYQQFPYTGEEMMHTGDEAPMTSAEIGQTVQIPAEPNVNLQGSLHIPDGAQGIVIFAHGSGGNRHSPRNIQVAAELHQAGLATLLLDLLTTTEDALDKQNRQFRFDLELLARRLCGTVDWLTRQTETRPLNIGIFGASTGAGAALVAAALRSSLVSAVVSRGGRPDLAWIALSEVQAPTLLIVGANDEQVLELNRQAVARMHTIVQLEVVPGASHLFEEPGTLETVAALTRDWFIEYLTADGQVNPNPAPES